MELHPDLPLALAHERVEATYVETSAPDGYWAMLAEWWGRGETFIVLEQDKIPVRGALQELWECGHLWCTFPVEMRESAETAPYPSLSCTKFDRELMSLDPDLLVKVGTLDLGFGEREWSRLDLAIAGLLESLCAPHWHARGRVMHLH